MARGTEPKCLSELCDNDHVVPRGVEVVKCVEAKPPYIFLRGSGTPQNVCAVICGDNSAVDWTQNLLNVSQCLVHQHSIRLL